VSYKVWPLYIESQQAILSATQFVIDMNRFVKSPEEYAAPVEQMQEIHTRIDGLVAFANGKSHETIVQAFDPETTAAQALRCMSIVKLNRSDCPNKSTSLPLRASLILVVVPASSYTDTVPSLTYQYLPSRIAT